MVDIDDVIKQVNFGDHRLRSLGVAGGQILAFPIDIDRRPYNTLALPCECVIPVASRGPSADDFGTNRKLIYDILSR